MSISPALGEDLARPLVEAYLEVERTLLARIARALGQGLDAPDWAERKLLEVQLLRRAAERDLTALDAANLERVREAIYTAANRGSAAAVADLAAATSVPFAQAASPLSLSQVETLVAATHGRLSQTHLRILRTTDDAYRSVIAQASTGVLTGADTRRQAAQAALDRFATRGVTGFIDTAGRSWDMASYVEMAMRATTGQAAVQAHVDQLAANGQDLVIVSDAPQECDLCRPWEGAVLSISGATVGTVSGEGGYEVAGTLGDAEAAGLFHPGCRHDAGLFIPGVTRPLTGTADPQGDADRQRLRAMERTLRSWKRREAVALDDVAAAKARGKVRDWQARIRQHTDTTSAKRQPQREQIGAAR